MTVRTSFGFSSITGTWYVDRERSSLSFGSRRPHTEPLSGRFLHFDGGSRSGRPSMCSVRLDSLLSQRPLGDEQLFSVGLPDTGRFPMIRFASTGIPAFDRESFLLTGNLTIANITRPVVLEGAFRGPLVNPDGSERVEYELLGRLNAADFDLAGWGCPRSCGGLTSADKIDLKLEIVAERRMLERAA